MLYTRHFILLRRFRILVYWSITAPSVKTTPTAWCRLGIPGRGRYYRASVCMPNRKNYRLCCMRSILRCSTCVAIGKINLLDHGAARESVTRSPHPVEDCPRQDAGGRTLSKIFFKSMRASGRMLSRIFFKSMQAWYRMLSRYLFKRMRVSVASFMVSRFRPHPLEVSSEGCGSTYAHIIDFLVELDDLVD